MNIAYLRSRSKDNRKGLNLIEVVIATFLYLIIMVSLLNVFNQGYRFLRKSRMAQTAYFLAQEKMEEVLTGSVFPGPGSHNETRANVTNFTDLQRQVNFTCPPAWLNSSYSGLAAVNVTVYWQGQQGEQSFSLLSLVSNLTD
jgi:Tfp pilus assembly protein PilV